MKNVVQDLTSAGLDWDREKWRGSVASKFIRGGEKNAVKYADEVIVLSKGVQDYFKETYGKIAFIFSISIELLQLLLRLGTFQLSDIFYNTVGGVLGGLMYCAVMKARKRL